MKNKNGPLLLFFLLFSSFSDAANFAEAPPENESVKKLYAKEVHLEPAVQGKPLPTNDWWTTLLADSPFRAVCMPIPLPLAQTHQR